MNDISSIHTENTRAERDLKQHALATEAVARGDMAGAMNILIDLASHESPCWQVYNDLGALALATEDLESAETMFIEAISRQAPIDTQLHLAKTLYLAERHEEALNAIGPVLRADGGNIAAHALIREIIGKIRHLSPVAWAKLVSELRQLTPELRAKLDGFDDATAENAQLRQEIQRLTEQVKMLRNLLQGAGGGDSLAASWLAIRESSDEEWLAALLDSVEQPVFKGFLMPGFPEEYIQIGMVGSSNQTALREGFNFYRTVRKICQKDGVQWDIDSQLLDFGTGWGRYARIFVRDFRPDNVYGIDVDPGFIDICKKTFPFGHFSVTPTLPPCGLETGKFDLIIGYSVFSHLAEHVANAWIGEFARLLKPGGHIAITTQGKSLIRVCAEHRKNNEHKHVWHKNLAESFVDTEACEQAYDRGEFLFSATGGGEHRAASVYGEAIIPKKYVEKHWSNNFELVAFLEPDPLPQALIVLRKIG